jgi:DNA polymerase III alpha subunit
MEDQTPEIINATTATLDSLENHSTVRICGYFYNFKEIMNKKGELIAFGDLEDQHGFIRVLVPNVALVQYREILHSQKELVISGILEISEPFSMIRVSGVEQRPAPCGPRSILPCSGLI